jgi:alcohol dehydrogenase class IV
LVLSLTGDCYSCYSEKMICRFDFECPQNIHFGPGSREILRDILTHFGEKVFLLSGSSWFEQSGWKRSFSGMLKNFYVCYEKCPKGEPSVESVTALIEIAREFGPDVIVGIGGGSVLDTAKAISGLIDKHDSIEDYLEGIGKGKKLTQKGIPWIAFPTTSGTGAEATKNAVIKSSSHQAKKSFRSPFIIAHTVIVDPELTLDLPCYITGISGMDAIVQLLESFVSKKAKPIPKALGKDAFPVMLSSLAALGKNRKNLNARTGAAYGALISGMTLANSGLGAVHGFASGIGGLFDIPHGLICAVFLIPVLKINAEVIRADVRDMLGSMIDDPKEDPVVWLIKEVDTLLHLFHISKDLKQYTIKKEMAVKIAEKSGGSSMSGNPKELSMKEREQIILSVI